MLAQLEIKNLVLIEQMSLLFSPGFNVLTGETGAGKSLIATSLDLLLGKRASSELVRKGQSEAEIVGIFDITDEKDVKQRLEEAGLPVDDELLIRRIIPSQGRHRVYINGKLASLSVLFDLTQDLASVMGQHEQHSLFDNTHQLFLVDGFAKNLTLKEAMKAAFSEYTKAKNDYQNLLNQEKDRAAKIEFLSFQLDELDKLNPKEGEFEELEKELEILKHQSTLLEATSDAAHHLYETDDSIFERLGALARNIDGVSQYDSSLQDDAKQLLEASIIVEEAARSLSKYSQNLEADPNKLDEVQERLESITRLSRKHSVLPNELVAVQHQLFKEVHALKQFEQTEEHLKQRCTDTKKAALSIAQKLSQKRLLAAQKLGKSICAELVDLSFNNATFEANVSFNEKQLCETGADTVEFLVELNKGEGAHPLKKVASGGELSRMMLAIKRAFQGVGPVGTYVFDEVDAGIGGAVAVAVGKKLALVSKHHQLICISHLPQIAALADAHFHVSKKQHKNRTQTQISQLKKDTRVKEISRMLGGDIDNQKMLAAAKELLKNSA